MASTRIFRTAGTPTSTKKFTVSFWIKKTGIGGDHFVFNATADANNRSQVEFNTDDEMNFICKVSGTNIGRLRTTRKFTDPSAFYHFVAVLDTTESTSSNRMKLYVNGVQETDFITETYPSLNADASVSGTHTIGSYYNGSSASNYLDGLLTHVHFTDGYAYQASTFGSSDSTSGIWKPNTAPSVTYGTNGFFLKFENSGNLDLDSSSNGHTFSTTGTLTQNVDTPSNNFAVLNSAYAGGGSSTLTNGGLTYSLSNYSYNARSTLGFTKGKWYWEQKVNNATSVRIGLVTSGFTNDLDTDNVNAYYGGSGGGGVYLLLSNNSTSWQRTNNNTSRSVDTYTSAIATGSSSIMMGAVDADAGKLWIGVDGVWMNSGNPAGGTNNQITFSNDTGDELQVMAGFGTSSSRVSYYNFGSGYFGTTAVSSGNADGAGLGIFEYSVPSGFFSICTQNIKNYG